MWVSSILLSWNVNFSFALCSLVSEVAGVEAAVDILFYLPIDLFLVFNVFLTIFNGQLNQSGPETSEVDPIIDIEILNQSG